MCTHECIQHSLTQSLRCPGVLPDLTWGWHLGLLIGLCLQWWYKTWPQYELCCHVSEKSHILLTNPSHQTGKCTVLKAVSDYFCRWISACSYFAASLLGNSLMHGNETWHMQVELELKLNHAEMNMIRRKCEVKLNEQRKVKNSANS